MRLQFRTEKYRGLHPELLILGAKDADGNVIVLGPRSEVGIGEPVF
jgi:tRNA-binding protein